MKLYDKRAMDTRDLKSVKTCLNGLFKPDFVSDHKVVIDATEQRPTQGVYLADEAPSINIFDGRQLQNSEDDGQADFCSRFFKRHGFVLLQHESKVLNWDSGAFGATDALGNQSIAVDSDINEVERHYVPEIDDIIRRTLLPGERIEVNQTCCCGAGKVRQILTSLLSFTMITDGLRMTSKKTQKRILAGITLGNGGTDSTATKYSDT